MQIIAPSSIMFYGRALVARSFSVEDYQFSEHGESNE